jgi:hypothetical protein
MNAITSEEFVELINYKNAPCISIYLPTHQAGNEVNAKQDAIVLKNELQDIRLRLLDEGTDEQVVTNLLQPAFALYKDDTFWNNQLNGLAVFVANGFLKIIKLPFTVNEEYYINSHFLISPLMPLLTNNETFYLLAISKHDAKFYHGDAYSLQRLEIEGLPNGMEDVVHFEEKEGQQLHRRGGGNGSERGASLHGHASGQLDEKDNIARYMEEVDRTLWAQVLHDKNILLVLAGVEYLLPIYKSVSKYKFIADEGITGNREHDSISNLHKEACALLTSYFAEKHKKALKNYYNQIATAQTSSMPEKIVPASHYAQISDLFICKGAHVWGTFDEDTQRVNIHTEKEDGDDCLLNEAAIHTYINGGTVYTLEPGEMPKESIMAAFLRF